MFASAEKRHTAGEDEESGDGRLGDYGISGEDITRGLAFNSSISRGAENHVERCPKVAGAFIDAGVLSRASHVDPVLLAGIELHGRIKDVRVVDDRGALRNVTNSFGRQILRQADPFPFHEEKRTACDGIRVGPEPTEGDVVVSHTGGGEKGLAEGAECEVRAGSDIIAENGRRIHLGQERSRQHTEERKYGLLHHGAGRGSTRPPC